MEVAKKLDFIKRVSGRTQQSLANEIGVTFVSLNRWMNCRAKPLYQNRLKINKLYKEHVVLQIQIFVQDSILMAL